MPSTQPVAIANSERVDFHSTINGRSYSISVALPLGRVPEAGCPVLYVLDGYWYFGSAVEAVRANAPGVAVVGIGYPGDQGYIQSVLGRHRPLPVWLEDQPDVEAAVALDRTYDLTLPVTDRVLAAHSLPEYAVTSKQVGGLDGFLATLETQVKPRVAAMTRIDPFNQAIFGHSLGGLAVLHALFVRPDAYRTFIAASPSIWWGGKAVLAGEAKFTETVRSGKAAPRVLITMGSEEETADTKDAARLKVAFAPFAALIRKHRMVENARELTARLQALRGSGGLEVEDYALFAKQHHGISPWPALGRAVAFAFPS